MHPVLFQILNFRLHTYGAAMGVAFMLAMHLVLLRGRRLGISEYFLNQTLLISLVGGIIGARLLFVIVDDPVHFLRHPFDVFKVWKGGLVFLGGLIVAATGVVVYARRNRFPVLQVCDLLSPALVLGHAIGRIGCFMAGCCYGKTCELPWAVTFTDPAGVGLKNVPLHPTQLYSSALLVLLYFILLTVRRYSRFHGMVFLTYVTLYPIGRWFIETLRFDNRGAWMGLSTAQLFCIPMFVIGAIALGVKWRARLAKA